MGKYSCLIKNDYILSSTVEHFKYTKSVKKKGD